MDLSIAICFSLLGWGAFFFLLHSYLNLSRSHLRELSSRDQLIQQLRQELDQIQRQKEEQMQQLLEHQLQQQLAIMRPLVEEEIRRKSRISAATSLGRILEKLAPVFLGLLDSEEVRALYVGGALPVDYILVSREGIRFVEVKTGKDPNRLSPKEREFRDLVQNGRVSWQLVHFPTEEREESNGEL